MVTTKNNTPQPYDNEMYDQFEALRDKGYTYKEATEEVGKKYGVSGRTVGNAVTRVRNLFGIKSKKHNNRKKTEKPRIRVRARRQVGDAPPHDIKRLVWDTEWSKAVALVYPSNKPQYIRYQDYMHEQFMYMASWRWYGEKKSHYVSVLDFPDVLDNDFRDDREVVKKLHSVIRQADVSITHNGDNFDLKMFKTKVIEYGLEPLHNIFSVDTLKEARSYRPLSKSLRYLVDKYELGAKIKNEEGLENRIAVGCKKALEEVIEYGLTDTDILYELYEYMLPYLKKHPNLNTLFNDNIDRCPRCAGQDLVRDGTRHFTQAGRYDNYKCNSCGYISKHAKNRVRVNLR